VSEQIRKRSAAVTPRGVNHLVINVRDMEESHHFWCDLLGFQQVGELHPRENRPNMTMRFYSGVVDDVNHHDIALVSRRTCPSRPPSGRCTRTARDQPHRDHLSIASRGSKKCSSSRTTA
jgi:catechol 2,3-dioxygenase-like lactoylglutathione lyase family enzyme